MIFPLYIAQKYFKSGNKSGATQLISWITLLGLIVGSAALLIILSVFGGLKSLTYNLYQNTSADILIIPKKGKVFTYTNEIQENLKTLSDIKFYTPIVEEKVFLHYNNYDHVAYLTGITKNYTQIVAIDSFKIVGDYLNPEEYPNGVYIGSGVGTKLSIPTYDSISPIEFYIPKKGVSQSLNPEKLVNTTYGFATGVFNINEEKNEKYIYAPLTFAQELLQYNDNQISALEIKTNTESNTTDLIALLNTKFKDLKAISADTEQEVLKKMIQTEQLVIYLIFSLVLLITSFNLIGTLIIQKLNKSKDIETLQQLGMTKKQTESLFFYYGIIIVLIGCFSGIGSATIVLFLQKQFSFLEMIPNLPYPVEFSLWNYSLVLFTVISVGILTSYFTIKKLHLRK